MQIDITNTVQKTFHLYDWRPYQWSVAQGRYKQKTIPNVTQTLDFDHAYCSLEIVHGDYKVILSRGYAEKAAKKPYYSIEIFPNVKDTSLFRSVVQDTEFHKSGDEKLAISILKSISPNVISLDFNRSALTLAKLNQR